MKPLSPASPHAIIMVGIPGSGKSTFGERFADTFQAPILNRLKLQKDLQLDNDQADQLAEIMLAEFLKTKRTILIEGGVDTKTERQDLVKQLHKAGYRSLIVWVQTDTATSRKRAAKPYPAGSGIEGEDFDAVVDLFETPQPPENLVVISGKHTYATQLKVVLKQLAASSPAPQKPAAAPTTTTRRGRGRGITVR